MELTALKQELELASEQLQDKERILMNFRLTIVESESLFKQLIEDSHHLKNEKRIALMLARLKRVGNNYNRYLIKSIAKSWN